MHEADIDQRNPGQPGRDQQQAGGDEFGRARARRRRFGDVMVVMAVIVMGVRGMGIGAVAMASS